MLFQDDLGGIDLFEVNEMIEEQKSYNNEEDLREVCQEN